MILTLDNWGWLKTRIGSFTTNCEVGSSNLNSSLPNFFQSECKFRLTHSESRLKTSGLFG